jgi:hypothetical protein
VDFKLHHYPKDG